MAERRKRGQAYLYPDSLVAALEASWATSTWGREKVPELPHSSILSTLLNTAYHATFTIEEGRRTRFRLIFVSRDQLEVPLDSQGNTTARNVSFRSPACLCSPGNHTVGPSDRPDPVSIGVSTGKGRDELIIWGLVDSGSSWTDFVTHEASGGYPPPNFLTIGAREPGI